MKQTKPSQLVEVPLKQSQQNEVLHCFLICQGLITVLMIAPTEPLTGFKGEGDWNWGGGVENEETSQGYENDVEETFTFH